MRVYFIFFVLFCFVCVRVVMCLHFPLFLLSSSQGSRDNMSIVLIAFEGAPTVSEEAVKKDKDLDEKIERKVKGKLFKLTKLDGLHFLFFL